MDLSATLRSADEMFRLTPEDYIAEFPALITLLQKQYGEGFYGVRLRALLPSGPVELSSDPFSAAAPTAPHVPNSVVDITIITCKKPGFPRGHYHYSLDHITVMHWSAPIGRGPIKEWIGFVRAKKYLREAERRIAPIKEELMAAAWSPVRVERLLEAGGPEALDAL